jgi:hypothetical protein
MPHGSPAMFSVVLCSFSVGLLPLPSLGADEPSYAPQPFACEVRYYFREQVSDAEPGEKRASAPSFEREGLPTSRLLISKGVATRIVRGRVPHLPYRFLIKIVRGRDSEHGALEVRILKLSGESVVGYPQVMQNPLSSAGENTRREFEIPISRALKKNIEKGLLARDQFITNVELIVGMDEGFLSEDFPK